MVRLVMDLDKPNYIYFNTLSNWPISLGVYFSKSSSLVNLQMAL